MHLKQEINSKKNKTKKIDHEINTKHWPRVLGVHLVVT